MLPIFFSPWYREIRICLAIGHVCCLDDPKAEIAQQLAKRGVFVGFDRVTINAIIPDEKRVAMILAFLDAGHADHLLLSSDFSTGRALKKNGGPDPLDWPRVPRARNE